VYLHMESSKVADETQSMDKYMHTDSDGLSTQGDAMQRLLAMIWSKHESRGFKLFSYQWHVFIELYTFMRVIETLIKVMSFLRNYRSFHSRNRCMLAIFISTPLYLPSIRPNATVAVSEVSERQLTFGRNELVSVRTPKWKILLSKFQGPMPYMVR